MCAIFKREFKNFFQNVIGWVFIAAIVFISSLYFKAFNLQDGNSDIRYVLIRLLTIVIFAIPVLSMRILTEERKNKVDQLTLTSPASVGKIVFGKYLSMVAVYAISNLFIGAFLLLIAKYATIDWGINLLSLLGFFLYGCACIAICMFVSSFTESQVIAALLSIVAMFIIYLMAGIQFLFEGTENKILVGVSKALGILNFSEKYDILLSGVFDIKVIIYFISVILVFVFLTTQVIQQRRFSVSVKNISLRAFSISMIVIVIATAVFANLGLAQLPAKYTEFDLTQNKLFSLCDATKNAAASVDKPVTIYVYAAEDNKDETLDRILNKYTALNSNIKVVYKDPDKSPKFYEKYTDNKPEYNCIFMENNERNKFIDYGDMFVSDYSYDQTTGQPIKNVSYDYEGRITAGLDYLVSGREGTAVYAITGHDEVALTQGYMDAMAKANCKYEDLMLLGNEIPEDCKLLVISAPSTDYSADDADKVINYLSAGGQAIITIGLIDDIPTTMPNFNKILDYFEVTVGNGLVVDMASFNQSPYFIIPEVANNVATQGVYGKKPVLMLYSKPLYANSESEEVNAVSLLTSSSESYNRTNLTDANDFNYAEGDPVGPFDVAMSVTKGTYDNTAGRAFIFTSPFLFSDEVDQSTANASATIFMNIVNSVSGDEGEGANVVPVKSMDSEPFIISNASGLVIFIVLMLVLPVVLLVAGFVIWTRRRRR